jgi:hypothetical protein
LAAAHDTCHWQARHMPASRSCAAEATASAHASPR